MLISKKMAVMILTAGLMLCVGIAVHGASYMLDPIPDNTYKIGMRYIRPNYEYDIMTISSFSGTYDFYGSIPIGEAYTVNFSLPFTRGNYPDIVFTDEHGDIISRGMSSHQFGNISVGGQYRFEFPARSTSILSVNIILPTAQSGKFTSGTIAAEANPFEVERIVPDLAVMRVTIATRYQQRNPGDVGYYIGGDVGPMIWFPTGDLEDDPELLLRYGLCAGARFGKVTLGGELYGLYVVTEDLGPVAEQFDNYAAIGVSVLDFPVRPSLFMTFPLDDEFSNYINFMYGFRLEAAIPKI